MWQVRRRFDRSLGRCGAHRDIRLRCRPLSLRRFAPLSLSRERRGASIFPFAGHDRDRRSDLHALAAFGHQDLGDLAFVDRFEFHRRFVGFDFRQDVAGFDLVALFHQPFGERALFHGRRKGGHLEFDRHAGVS